MSKIVESFPEGYGYVIFSAVGSQFVNMWMAINVGRARKKYEVEVCSFLYSLNPCPAEPRYTLLCKQCTSRSVGF